MNNNLLRFSPPSFWGVREVVRLATALFLTVNHSVRFSLDGDI